MQPSQRPDEVAPGLFRWACPHPEWHPTIEWGREVASWALVCGDTLALVDPLLPAEDDSRHDGVVDALDTLTGAARALEIMITVPYHTRSAESLFFRFRDRLPTRIWGHRAVTSRWTRQDTPLEIVQPGTKATPARLPAGAYALPIGNPRRYETPLWFPDHRALAFGDAIIGYEGALRVWQQGPFSKKWYVDKYRPTLLPLLKLDVERVLVTHGPPVLHDGRAALRAALGTAPWDHTTKQERRPAGGP